MHRRLVVAPQLGWFPVDFVEISAQARAAVTHPPPPPLPTATSVRATATAAPQPPPPPPHPAGAGAKGGGGVETVKALFAFAAQVLQGVAAYGHERKIPCL